MSLSSPAFDGMPKRTDIHSILIIGSGPIVIGQACEFDYSGTQACKALREEGFRVVLVNSNPATIMTDPEFADRTYIEPITPDCVEKIIQREKAEMARMGAQGKLVLLPTLGGQTALNTAMELWRRGVLEREGIEMIGANAKAIERGEDRQVFKDLMISIGLDVPVSGTAHSLEEARAVLEKIGRLPVIIRPAFTLGGTGGGIAYNREEFELLAKRGLDLSPVSEILRNCMFHRKARSDGRAHRRLHHRCTGPDAYRQGIPNHARRLICGHPRSGRRDRWFQHTVRGASGNRQNGDN